MLKFLPVLDTFEEIFTHLDLKDLVTLNKSGSNLTTIMTGKGRSFLAYMPIEDTRKGILPVSIFSHLRRMK